MTDFTVPNDPRVGSHESVIRWNGGRITRHIARELVYSDSGPQFIVRGRDVAATVSIDVHLLICATSDGIRHKLEYPRCPDCGATILRAEAGGETGSRVCAGRCGPRFIDTHHALPFGVLSALPACSEVVFPGDAVCAYCGTVGRDANKWGIRPD
ncbi:MAG: hypothetical protein OXF98_06165 [Rhodospirillaceae bacterium]|nr:hypothetical protein [Rhodospirillaceae bacterium]